MRINILLLLLVLRISLADDGFFQRKLFPFESNKFNSLDEESSYQFSEFTDITSYVNEFYGDNKHTAFNFACGEISINGPVEVKALIQLKFVRSFLVIMCIQLHQLEAKPECFIGWFLPKVITIFLQCLNVLIRDGFHYKL